MCVTSFENSTQQAVTCQCQSAPPALPAAEHKPPVLFRVSYTSVQRGKEPCVGSMEHVPCIRHVKRFTCIIPFNHPTTLFYRWKKNEA